MHKSSPCFQIWPMGMTVGLTLLITLSVFPGVVVYITSTMPKSQWTEVYYQPTITFLLFNVMDMVSREVLRFVQWVSSLSQLSSFILGLDVPKPRMKLHSSPVVICKSVQSVLDCNIFTKIAQKIKQEARTFCQIQHHKLSVNIG